MASLAGFTCIYMNRRMVCAESDFWTEVSGLRGEEWMDQTERRGDPNPLSGVSLHKPTGRPSSCIILALLA